MSKVDLKRHPSGIKPKLVNVVATLDLKRQLKLDSITKIFAEARLHDFYGQQTAKIRIQKPKTTAIVFETGRVIITGAKDEKEFKRAAKKFMRKVAADMGFNSTSYEHKIRCIMATANLNFNLDLLTFSEEQEDFVEVIYGLNPF